jgi:hypothetical protein
VGYAVVILDEARDYVLGLEQLTVAGREKVLADLAQHLARYGDTHRANQSLRLGHESYCFRLEWAFLDEGRGHRIDFIVSDEHAPFGVLVVAYADYAPEAPS